MSCEIVCGTGGWSGPKPGDPDNNVVLSAKGIAGGIEVSWTYPAINPFAVSHVILYRGITDQYSASTVRAIVSGNEFFDRIELEDFKLYYYWIQVVSINGTTADPIGPASAYPTDSIAGIIERLSGQIDAGYLAQSLRTQIDKIEVISQDVAQETLDRIADIEAYSELLASVQVQTGEIMTAMLQETTQRRTADSGQIDSINALAIGMGENAAAIFEQKTLQISTSAALASQIDVLSGTVAGNTAAILNVSTAQATAQDAQASALNALTAVVNANTAAIQTESTARVTDVSSLASSVATVQAKADINTATIQTTQTAQTDQFASLASQLQTVQAVANDAATNAALAVATAQTANSAWASATDASASQISTVQTQLSGNIASVQTSLTSQINTVDGKVTGIGAQYTAIVDVNGLVGGFGVYNNGQTVEAGFDVDTFWVGKSTLKQKPFIISGPNVFIDNAFINQLTADKIDTRGLTIKDANGNILFGSGTTLDFANVGGTTKPADNATVGAPAGTMVAGVSASTVASAATNFNNSNDRNASAVTAPTILADGTAMDHTLQADGSADISFEWAWGGNEGDIDGFLIYIYQSSSSAAYTFGTTAAAETVYTVPANKRAFILFGTAANQYYTFGVQAYRAVDKDINANGVIKSTLVKPSLAAENPYRPSANVAFTGDVTGSINGTSTTTVLNNISSAATTATWANVSGTGKPADNATVGATIGTNLSGQITAGNASTFIADAAIGNAQIGGAIYSTNYSAGVAGWKIDKNGTFEANTGTFRGAINVGAYTGFSWPASGQTGAHLSNYGLLLGNANDGKFFQVNSDGNVYAPGWKCENGTFTISALNVIGTGNIQGNAVTVPVSAFNSDSGAITIGAPFNLSVGIASSGNTILIAFNTLPTANFSSFGSFVLDLLEDGAVIYSAGSDQGNYSGTLSRRPSAGNHTYTLRCSVTPSPGSMHFYNSSLFLLEAKR